MGISACGHNSDLPRCLLFGRCWGQNGHQRVSWCINRRVDGGLELPLKVVQTRLGHASNKMTADTYGHLFPRGDDGSELAAAEQAFIG